MTEEGRLERDATLALPPGARVGDMQITGVIEQTPLGVVYAAHQESLERKLAVKEYLPVAIAQRDVTTVVPRTPAYAEAFLAGLQAFVEEARLLARLSHPALVKVLYCWDQNGTAYMAMPLYAGMSLQAHLRSVPLMQETALKAMIARLLEALEELHRAGRIHGDLSPENILVMGDGQPLLLTPGAARQVIAARTQDVTVVLNQRYLPLEQCAEDPSLPKGPWTDIYSLAAVARFAISGRAPQAPTARLVTDAMPPLTGNFASYSRGFLSAIDRALAVRPEARPQSTASFRQMLGIEPSSNAPPTAPHLQSADPVACAATASPSLSEDDERTRFYTPGDAIRQTNAPSPGRASAVTPAGKVPAVRSDPSARGGTPDSGVMRGPRGSDGGDGQVASASSTAPTPLDPSSHTRAYVIAGAVGLIAMAIVGSTVWSVLRPAALGRARTAEPTLDSRIESRPAVQSAPAARPPELPGGSEKDNADNTPPKPPADNPTTGAAVSEAPAALASSPRVNVAPPVTPADATVSNGERTERDVDAPSMQRPAANASLTPAGPVVGKVRFQVRPWGDVYIDGKYRRPSPPLKEITLPQGRHTVEVRNPGFPSLLTEVEVRPGGTITVAHAFK